MHGVEAQVVKQRVARLDSESKLTAEDVAEIAAYQMFASKMLPPAYERCYVPDTAYD